MPKIHALMLGWEFPPLISGGLGVACEGLAKALAGKVELGLILPASENPAPDEPIQIIPINYAFHESDLDPYPDARPTDGLYQGDLEQKVMSYAWRALKTSRDIFFDVIHAHDWMTAVAGLEIRKQSGQPLIFHVHSLTYDRGGPDEKGWIHEIEKRAIQEADLVIAVSDYTKKICVEHYNASPSKTVVVHNGISPVKAYRTPKVFPDQLVVFLGRITRQKNPIHFLEIAREVLTHNPQVRFAMAGTGDQLHTLMAASVRLGISDRCHFTGFLDRKGVQHLLSMADVYCMPSVSEPFGLSALEAAQFGVPSVISAQSGASEILPDAEIADANNTEQMALGILKQLKAGNVQQAHPLRSWDEAANEILNLYQKLQIPT